MGSFQLLLEQRLRRLRAATRGRAPFSFTGPMGGDPLAAKGALVPTLSGKEAQAQSKQEETQRARRRAYEVQNSIGQNAVSFNYGTMKQQSKDQAEKDKLGAVNALSPDKNVDMASTVNYVAEAMKIYAINPDVFNQFGTGVVNAFRILANKSLSNEQIQGGKGFNPKLVADARKDIALNINTYKTDLAQLKAVAFDDPIGFIVDSLRSVLIGTSKTSIKPPSPETITKALVEVLGRYREFFNEYNALDPTQRRDKASELAGKYGLLTTPDVAFKTATDESFAGLVEARAQARKKKFKGPMGDDPLASKGTLQPANAARAYSTEEPELVKQTYIKAPQAASQAYDPGERAGKGEDPVGRRAGRAGDFKTAFIRGPSFDELHRGCLAVLAFPNGDVDLAEQTAGEAEKDFVLLFKTYFNSQSFYAVYEAVDPAANEIIAASEELATQSANYMARVYVRLAGEYAGDNTYADWVAEEFDAGELQSIVSDAIDSFTTHTAVMNPDGREEIGTPVVAPISLPGSRTTGPSKLVVRHPIPDWVQMASEESLQYMNDLAEAFMNDAGVFRRRSRHVILEAAPPVVPARAFGGGLVDPAVAQDVDDPELAEQLTQWHRLVRAKEALESQLQQLMIDLQTGEMYDPAKDPSASMRKARSVPATEISNAIGQIYAQMEPALKEMGDAQIRVNDVLFRLMQRERRTAAWRSVTKALSKEVQQHALAAVEEIPARFTARREAVKAAVQKITDGMEKFLEPFEDLLKKAYLLAAEERLTVRQYVDINPEVIVPESLHEVLSAVGNLISRVFSGIANVFRRMWGGVSQVKSGAAELELVWEDDTSVAIPIDAATKNAISGAITRNWQQSTSAMPNTLAVRDLPSA